jgi:4-hydroxybenzoate polyprenyltransferase
MFLIALSFSFLLIIYSYRLKRIVLLGNIAVSLTTAMAFVYGGFAVGHYKATLYPAGFAFFYHLGREVLKDMQDMEGDEKAGASTFAIKFGISHSIRLIIVVFILLIILTLIPYILHIYSVLYLMIVIAGIYPVLVFVIIQAYKNPSPDNLGRLSDILKANMIVGLLAIYLG